MRFCGLILLLAVAGCAASHEPTAQERKDYPVESWMLDQMWWAPGFMKHPSSRSE